MENRSIFRYISILVSVVFGLGVLTSLFSVLSFQVYKSLGYILPEIYVADQKVGLMKIDQAANTLDQYWNQSHEIIVVNGDQRWMAPLKTLGFFVRSKETAQLAFDIGNQLPFSQGMVQFWIKNPQKLTLPPVVDFNPDTGRAVLEAMKLTLDIKPVDAIIAFENGRAISQPGRTGRILNVDATLETITHDPRVTIVSGYMPLIFDEVAPSIPVIPDEVLGEAQKLFDSTIAIIAFDPVTGEEFEILNSMEYVINAAYSNGNLEIQANYSAILSALDVFDMQLGPDKWLDRADGQKLLENSFKTGEPAVFIVKHNPTVYTAKPGDTLLSIAWANGINYWRVLDANPGVGNAGVRAGQTIQIPSKDAQLPLPVVKDKRIVVSISEQHLWGYENGQMVFDEVISTGMADSPTQPGVFQVQTHEKNAYASNWDLWMPNFMGIYEAWPGFMNGFHALPILSGGGRLWAGALGRPVSYGCIILDIPAAERLFTWAEAGVVVDIKR